MKWKELSQGLRPQLHPAFIQTTEGSRVMNLQEHQLISSLFDRMRAMSPVSKDRDAEAIILDRIRSVPDAPYLLVQSVLLQQQSLQKAEARNRELEDIVRTLNEGPASAPGSSEQTFLRGTAGSGPASNTAVPLSQTRPTSSSPWAVSEGGVAEPSPSPPNPTVSFLSSALATASSVAGGMLLADGIRSLLGGEPLRQRLAVSDSTQDQLLDARNDSDEARKALAEYDRAWDDEEDMAESVVADGDTAQTSDA